MAKKSNEHGKKFKYLRPEQVSSLEEASLDELLKVYKKTNTDLKTMKKLHKDDNTLKELKASIKKYRDNHKKNDDIKQLQEEIKTLKKERDEGIETELSDKKELEAGYREGKAANQEKLDLITNLLDLKTRLTK